LPNLRLREFCTSATLMLSQGWQNVRHEHP